MPIAVVVAAFDAPTDQAIAAAAAQLSDLGARVARQPRHRPHLTLAAAEVEDVAAVSALAADVARRHGPVEMTLDRVGTFGRGAVVWVGPAQPGRLVLLQRAAADALGTLPPAWPERGGWVAHCTLARRVRPRAVQEFRARFMPLPALVSGLAVIEVGGTGDLSWHPLDDPSAP